MPPIKSPSKSIYTLRWVAFLYRPAMFIVSIHCNEEVASKLKTEPAACHTGRHLQKIGNNAFVQSQDPFMADNDSDSVPYRLILVADSGHGIYLESPTKDITRLVSKHSGSCWEEIRTMDMYKSVLPHPKLHLLPVSAWLVDFSRLQVSDIFSLIHTS